MRNSGILPERWASLVPSGRRRPPLRLCCWWRRAHPRARRAGCPAGPAGAGTAAREAQRRGRRCPRASLPTAGREQRRRLLQRPPAPSFRSARGTVTRNAICYRSDGGGLPPRPSSAKREGILSNACHPSTLKAAAFLSKLSQQLRGKDFYFCLQNSAGISPGRQRLLNL